MEKITVTVATATEMQNSFSKYLKMVMAGQQVVVTKNGKEVARMIPQENAVQSITASLVGVYADEEGAAPEEYDDYKERLSEELREKYGIAD